MRVQCESMTCIRKVGLRIRGIGVDSAGLLFWGTDQGEVVRGEQHSNGAFQHFGDYRTGVAPDCFNTLGVKCRVCLAGTLIHEAHVPLLGSQNARLIHLQESRVLSRVTLGLKIFCSAPACVLMRNSSQKNGMSWMAGVLQLERAASDGDSITQGNIDK